MTTDEYLENIARNLKILTQCTGTVNAGGAECEGPRKDALAGSHMIFKP